MGKFFSVDSPFYRFATKLTDILILNLLWVICSIPIVTMGAATTAIYYVSLKMVKNEEEYIVKSFFKSFKENFRQSTIMWIIFLVFGGILGIDYYYLFNIVETPTIVIKGITILASILYAFCILYAFPLQARYHNPIGRTILNSLVISLKYLGRTFIIILLIAVLAVIGFYSTTSLFFTLTFGMGVIAFVVSSYVLKIFEHLESLKEKWLEEQAEKAESEKAETEAIEEYSEEPTDENEMENSAEPTDENE